MKESQELLKIDFILIKILIGFLEGTLIAATLVEAETYYLYIRDEYYGLIKLIENEIKKLESLNIIKKIFLL